MDFLEQCMHPCISLITQVIGELTLKENQFEVYDPAATNTFLHGYVWHRLAARFYIWWRHHSAFVNSCRTINYGIWISCINYSDPGIKTKQKILYTGYIIIIFLGYFLKFCRHFKDILKIVWRYFLDIFGIYFRYFCDILGAFRKCLRDILEIF